MVAEAAILRLHLGHLNRTELPGTTTRFQGQLAIVGRVGDEETRKLFAPLDSR